MANSIKETLYTRIGKPWLDTVLASVGLILISPFFLAVVIAIRLTSPGPAFFRQVRVGQFGRPFRIFKFRTMFVQNPGQSSFLTAHGDPRITLLGRWLRKSKLDELPQLINIVLGEMSLVGPRPEVSKYTADYTDRQITVLQVKPGVTGPASNANVDEEDLLAGQPNIEEFYVTSVLPAKLELDIVYCKNISFVGDLKIILATITLVFRKIFGLFRTIPHASENQT